MSREQAIRESAYWFIGEDKEIEITVFQADGKTPANISGWTFEWVLRVDPDSATALITKTSVSGIDVIDLPGARVRVTVSRADTVNLQPGEHFHSLRRTDAGQSKVLVHGPALLSYAATR